MSFARAVAFVLKKEGGLVDDPNDPGGLTNHGVCLRYHPELTRQQIIDLTDAQAAEIFHGQQYWGAIKGDELPGALQLPMLDTAVSEAPEHAIRFLQEALYVGVDGILGPKTLHAARVAMAHATICRFTAHRVFYLTTKESWEHYGKGWTARAVQAAMEA